MYEIRIAHHEFDEREFVNTKQEAINFIARELGCSKRSIAKEIKSQMDTTIYRDNDDTRIWVWYTK